MADDSLDLAALDDWIGDRLPGAGAGLTARRMGEQTGTANALYLLSRGKHQWVLRRPPAAKNHPSASDTKREWRILRALEGTGVPHPAPRLLCEDPGVTGSTFMIMDVVDGFTPGFELPRRSPPALGCAGAWPWPTWTDARPCPQWTGPAAAWRGWGSRRASSNGR